MEFIAVPRRSSIAVGDYCGNTRMLALPMFSRISLFPLCLFKFSFFDFLTVKFFIEFLSQVMVS